MALDNSEQLKDDEFFKSSYGLIFFGVPNLGLNPGNLKTITDGQPNQRLIIDLEGRSESEPTQYLDGLRNQFIRCCKKQSPPFEIVSYYERRKTATLKEENGTLSRDGDLCLMVTRESACRIGNEDSTHNNHMLDTDHSRLVKFPGQSDDGYIRVKQTLESLVENAPATIRGRFWPEIFYDETRLSDDEKRHWDDLNVPHYNAFKENEEKLARPVDGTLQWLVSDEVSDRPTGTDSLQKETFDRWRDSDTQNSLLIQGPPGKGKSVLTRFVVEHLSQTFQTTPVTHKVIYYFCNIKGDEKLRDASTILRAIIVQLCEDRRLFRKLPNRFQDPAKWQTFHSASIDELWGVFSDLVKHSPYSWIYCAIDGLDVYTVGIDDLANRFQKLKDPEYRFKLFCTSRPDGPIQSFPPGTKWAFRPPTSDLKRFIKDRLRNAELGKFKELIYEEVLDRSGWTFLWISIILHELRKLPYLTKYKIKAVIQKTPQELHDLYTSLIQAAFRLDPRNIAILAWVTFAKYPLSLKQMETAATIMEPEVTSVAEFRMHEAPLDSDTIQKHLGTLIDIINGRLYLIHQSLQDFLKESSEIWSLKDIELRFSRPELALGKACIKFLSFEDLQDFCPKKEHSLEVNRLSNYCWWNDYRWATDLREHDCFLLYVSEFWFQHIHHAEDVLDDAQRLDRILRGPNRRLWEASNDIIHIGYNPPLWGTALRYQIDWLARLLLDQTSPILSEAFHKDYLREAARDPTVLRELLDHPITAGLKVHGKVLEEAVTCYRATEALDVLLEKRGHEFQIPVEVVRAAARASSVDGMELLLEKRGHEVQITTNIVKEAAKSLSKDMMELLLEKRGHEIQITEEILKEAAINWNKSIMELLLEKRGHEVQITTGVLKSAAGSISGAEVLELLLEKRGHEIQITAEVVKAAAKSGNVQAMALILERKDHEVQITAEIVRAVAQAPSLAVMELLLEKRGYEVQITSEVVKLAADSSFGKELFELLLEKRGYEFQMTAEVVEAAARIGSEKAMALLLERRGGEFQITAEVVMAAARSSYSQTMMELLIEKRGEEVQITAELLEIAAGDPAGGGVLELLLNRGGSEIRITPKVVEAAARAQNVESMEMLLDRWGDEVQVTDEVVKAVASNMWVGGKMMMMLLQRKGKEIQIGPEVVERVARNAGQGARLMTLLLDRRGNEIQITPEVVQAAVSLGQPSVLVVLLDRRGRDVQITPKLVEAAAGWNDETMKLLLSRRGKEIQVTPEVIEAAAGSEARGDATLKLLFERRDSEVQITDKAVEAAAGNSTKGEEILMIFCGRRGSEIRITPKAMEEAANNTFSGEGIMEVLLEEKMEEVAAVMREEGEIICSAAASCGNMGILDLLCCRHHFLPLRDHWVKTATLYKASKDGDVDTVRQLLLDGVSPHTEGSGFHSPLSVAALCNSIEVVKLLVETTDVDVNSFDRSGRSPLFRACHNGHKEVVKVLIAAGADPTIEDRHGDTPLSFMKREQRFDEVIQILERCDHTSESRANDNPRSELFDLSRLKQPPSRKVSIVAIVSTLHRDGAVARTMSVASKYGSMMLSRVAARQAFAAPLAIRPFSTSLAYHNQSSRGPNDRPVRSNPLVGNYIRPKPAEPKAEDKPSTSTEHPESSQPPSSQHAPGSNAAMPPPPPPPSASASADPSAPASDQPQHAYDATSPNPPGYFDVGKILDTDINKVLSTFASKYAESLSMSNDPVNQPRVRTAAVTGRTVFLGGEGWVRGAAHSPEHAFVMLNRLLREGRVKELWHRQRFHERPGLRRKRLKMVRWRKRFKGGFKATAARVCELKKQGW
ncbi:hypothetical protein ACO1O0_008479 [Amphichorda felina]